LSKLVPIECFFLYHLTVHLHIIFLLYNVGRR